VTVYIHQHRQQSVDQRDPLSHPATHSAIRLNSEIRLLRVLQGRWISRIIQRDVSDIAEQSGKRFLLDRTSPPRFSRIVSPVRYRSAIRLACTAKTTSRRRISAATAGEIDVEAKTLLAAT